jgi:hypothetical protein
METGFRAKNNLPGRRSGESVQLTRFGQARSALACGRQFVPKWV